MHTVTALNDIMQPELDDILNIPPEVVRVRWQQIFLISEEFHFSVFKEINPSFLGIFNSFFIHFFPNLFTFIYFFSYLHISFYFIYLSIHLGLFLFFSFSFNDTVHLSIYLSIFFLFSLFFFTYYVSFLFSLIFLYILVYTIFSFKATGNISFFLSFSFLLFSLYGPLERPNPQDSKFFSFCYFEEWSSRRDLVIVCFKVFENF